MATDEIWPSDWMRGVLTVGVLAVLTRGTMHGYAIAAALADAGLGTIKGGTLYPLLGRLETAGHVTAEWQPGDGGPGRKVYTLTDGGRRHADHQARRWADFTNTTRALTDGALTQGDQQ